ncbi:ADK-domain-containing protein [Phlebopus sp. FC_14]|nr:ADK-domain-containing protein [Phlebopus sp. FC_14]
MASLSKLASALRVSSSPGSRSIAHSAFAGKALPFYLHSPRAGANTSDQNDDNKVLRMLMFGKPGAGKGTLSSRLVNKYDILSLSAGDLLRQHIAERTDVGRQAEEIVASGGLVPDDIMIRVITSKLDAFHDKHWILDGFPRTLVQGKLLDTHLENQNAPLSMVVNLDVADEVILSRISDRWIHLPSGRVYNMSYNRPKVHGFDDETGEPLTKRPDDNPEVFSRRLKQFYASTSPLLSYYSKSKFTRLISLQGETSEEIWPKLEACIRGSFPNIRERASARRRHSLSDAFMSDDEGRPAIKTRAGSG